MSDAFILIGSVVFTYLFIVVPIMKIMNILENNNKPNGAGISNSIVFNTETKESEAQQIPTTD